MGCKCIHLTDSETGYILNFEVYTGKRDIPDEPLTTNHLSQGYCVYMDNYYSSPTLFADLLTKGTDAVGTCVCDRKYFPKSQLNTLKLKKGESLFLRHKDITATRFYEKRNVYKRL